MNYPLWNYYPRNTRPAAWVADFVAVIAGAKGTIGTAGRVPYSEGMPSDAVLAGLRAGLVALGFEVESGKAASQKIVRPVLFGEQGEARVRYEVDAFHPKEGIVLEVEAGRGAKGNADYRDIVRTSLIVDARYLALLMPIEYRFKSNGKEL